MGLRRTCLRSLVLAGAGALASTSLAADLSVRGPEACPDAAELAFRVERTLGAPFAESGPLKFGVVFAAEPGSDQGFSARLQVQRANKTEEATERVIQAHDCNRLGDAVGVAIALAIGAPAAQPEVAAAPDPTRLTTVSAPAPEAGARDHEPSSSAESTEPPWLPVVQAFLLADGGSLASPGLGVGIGTELRGSRLALRAQGAVLFERRVGLESGSSAPGAELSLLLGSLSGCIAPFAGFRAAFSPFACAGWELGRLAGEGVGVAQPLAGQQLWTAPRVDAGLTGAIPGSPVRLGLQLSVAAPLDRDDFCLRELGCVYRAPGAVGRLSLGVELGFE